MDTLSPDTFLVALYTITDDLYRTTYPPTHLQPGAKPIMIDSEIITLALCVQWLKWSERKLIRYIKDYWQAYFPRLVSQSEYNKRFHALGNRIAYLVPLVEAAMNDYLSKNVETVTETNYSTYEVFDCVPVPLMKRCRGERAKLFSPPRCIGANIGKGGSDQDWYYGNKLALAVSPQGSVTSFILSPAKTSERWPAEYLFCYRNNPSGQPAPMASGWRICHLLMGKSAPVRMEICGRKKASVGVIPGHI